MTEEVVLQKTDILAVKLGGLTIVLSGATLFIMLFSSFTNTFLAFLPVITLLGGFAGGLAVSTKAAMGSNSPFQLNFKSPLDLVTVSPMPVKARRVRVRQPPSCPACHARMKEFVSQDEFGKEKKVFTCESPVHDKAIVVPS